ncbi:MAG TPA: hypothetical protein VF990_00260 [Candidatus Dormibacteraeota bacterium]
MVKKGAPKKVAPSKPAPKKATHHENLIERIGEELEARFFEGAELATETSSAETNIALAALGAIEGPRDVKQPASPKATHGKRKSPRPKKR